MSAALVAAVSSEWLKRRRSLTTRLVAGAAAFVPGIMFVARFRQLDALPALYGDPQFWPSLWRQAWEPMALMILPLSVMLLVSLITQIEDRSNAWKQLHAAPVALPVVYLAKLAVILALVAALVLLYVPAIYASGLLPALMLSRVPRPSQPFPLGAYAGRSLVFFVDALPVVAVQYGLALWFRSFLAPLAIGMACWILSIGTISWRYNFLIPYSYAGLDYLAVEYHRRVPLPASPPLIAAGCFLVFTLVGYALYARRRDKG